MGDLEEGPPAAKRAKVEELGASDEAAIAKIFLQLDSVHDRLMQHQEEVERKIAALKAKMREAATPLYDERRRLAAKIPNFWKKAVRPFDIALPGFALRFLVEPKLTLFSLRHSSCLR